MSVEPNNEIGTSLRRWRKERGLAASSVAAQAGIHKSTLARWESGSYLPSIYELEALLKVLEVGPRERTDLLSRLSAPRAVRRLRDEYGSGFGMPVGGDLLRALRVRKGWTQTETARAASVSQGQIAKWERSEAWPDAPRLHTLCWVLGATSDEVAALSHGRYRLAPDASTIPFDDKEYWQSRVRSTLDFAPTDTLDLFFLSLETRLWDLREKPFGLPLLGIAYANHARTHAFYARPESAGIWAGRALDLARNHRTANGDWGSALIAAGASLAADKQPTSLRKAIAVMEEWLPLLHGFNYRAWVMSDLSFYYAQLGDTDAAMHRNLQGLKEARVDAIEERFRQRDHAKLLMLLGRYREALEMLQACEALTREGPDASARHRMMEAECLIKLGSLPAASERLDQAHRHIVAGNDQYHLPQYNELRDQL